MTEPNRQSGEKEERIIEIEIERLRPFKEHPFQVKDDKEMFLLHKRNTGFFGRLFRNCTGSRRCSGR